MKLVDGIHCGVDGGIEPEGRHRGFQVVVDGLRHADCGDTLLKQLLGNRQRTVPTDGHQSIQSHHFETLDDPVRNIHQADGPIGLFHGILKGIPSIGGAKDGSTQVGDPAHRIPGQGNDTVVLQEPPVTVPDPVHLQALVDGAERHRPDHSIQSRCVPPSGIHSDLPNGAHGQALLVNRVTSSRTQASDAAR